MDTNLINAAKQNLDSTTVSFNDWLTRIATKRGYDYKNTAWYKALSPLCNPSSVLDELLATFVVDPPQQPNPPVPDSNAYISLDFENPVGSPWLFEPSGHPEQFISIPGQTGKGLGIITSGSSYGPNVNSQLAAVYLPANLAHAGWDNATNKPVLGQDTWYKCVLKFPLGYQPTTGQWNWTVEWHNDDKTASAGAYSIDVGVYTDYPVVNGAVGKNPRLAMRLAGGNSASPTYESIMLPPGILIDHWYEFLFHFVWHTDPAIGMVEWWVDGVPVVSKKFPTLYKNADGSQAYNAFGIYNYHLAAPWNSRIDYDSVVIGPTRSSVGG